MKVAFTQPFIKDYKGLPTDIQEEVDAQIARLLANPRHPSLRSKKMEGHAVIWEARVTKGYRLTFEIRDDTYLLRRVGTHDILRKP
jgi:mRNA-degrading endonuclease RelE of RelBE toxin-antitoxin system